MRAHRAILCAAVVLLGLGACRSAPPPAAPAPPEPGDRSRAFEPQRAWAHLEALAGFGSRTSGTEGHRLARSYIRKWLDAIGVEVREPQLSEPLADADGSAAVAVHNIAARIPGDSEDMFLLLAPYDTPPAESFEFVGANDGGSGAAVLLEIARVLAAAPLPYTTWIVFIDGESSFPLPEADVALALAPRRRLGSRLLARHLAEAGALSQVRLALALNRVCDPDLRIARDSLSHRAYRENFWTAARRLGQDEAFPGDAPFESVDESHRSLRAAGLASVVAIADTAFGGEDPPGPYAGSEDDDLEHCAAASLEVVGRVVLEALEQIAQRLAKVDRFVKLPTPPASIGLDILEPAGEEEPEASEAP